MKKNTIHSPVRWMAMGLCLGVLACESAFAQTPSVDTSSLTNTEPSLRDPFWPINYIPPAPVPKKIDKSVKTNAPPVVIRPEIKLPKWDMARKAIQVKGTTRVNIDKKTGRSVYFAVVNGKIVEEGDKVEVAYDGMLYRWRVTSISDKNVSLAKIDCVEK